MRGITRAALTRGGFALLLALWPTAARAASCTLSSTSLSFGAYDVFATAPTDSTATLTYRCSGNADIAIGITRGRSTTYNPREMAKGTERLSYNLYLDPARTTVWGDTTGGTQVYFDTRVPNNRNVMATVYGRIPAGQDVSAGDYTDTVLVVVEF